MQKFEENRGFFHLFKVDKPWYTINWHIVGISWYRQADRLSRRAAGEIFIIPSEKEVYANHGSCV